VIRGPAAVRSPSCATARTGAGCSASDGLGPPARGTIPAWPSRKQPGRPSCGGRAFWLPVGDTGDPVGRGVVDEPQLVFWSGLSSVGVIGCGRVGELAEIDARRLTRMGSPPPSGVRGSRKSRTGFNWSRWASQLAMWCHCSAWPDCPSNPRPSAVSLAYSLRATHRNRARRYVPRRLHDIRHCAATYLRHGGADMKEVQGILGHTTMALTSDKDTPSFSNSNAKTPTPPN
jgi:hypothetical protein